jgi:hypothetical protein
MGVAESMSFRAFRFGVAFPKSSTENTTLSCSTSPPVPPSLVAVYQSIDESGRRLRVPVLLPIGAIFVLDVLDICQWSPPAGGSNATRSRIYTPGKHRCTWWTWASIAVIGFSIYEIIA